MDRPSETPVPLIIYLLHQYYNPQSRGDEAPPFLPKKLFIVESLPIGSSNSMWTFCSLTEKKLAVTFCMLSETEKVTCSSP